MSIRITLLLEDELHTEIVRAAASMHWSVATYLRTATIERLRRDEAARPNRSAGRFMQMKPAVAPDTKPRSPEEAALFAQWDAEEKAGTKD